MGSRVEPSAFTSAKSSPSARCAFRTRSGCWKTMPMLSATRLPGSESTVKSRSANGFVDGDSSARSASFGTARHVRRENIYNTIRIELLSS